MSRLRLHGGVLTLLAMAILLRMAWIGRYPAFHSDEGFWANGARNHLLFGDAFLDNRLHPYLSPGTYVALLGHFSLLSPTMSSARVFSAFVGVATCVVVWVMARRLLPGRPWLPLLLFAVSGFTLLLHRIMLLEAHQTFWLTLAAALFLSRFRGSLALAGAAFGAALLVKSNSLIVVPAFLVALPAATERVTPSRDERVGGPLQGEQGTTPSLVSKLVPGAWFLFGAAVVAGVGYLIARADDPVRFGWAFQYELASKHFIEEAKDPVLFHFGRFGLRPLSVATITLELVKSDPFLVALAGVAIYRVLRRPSAAAREERLFAAWIIIVYLFDMVQINCTYRYLGPMAPAMVFLAAGTLDRWSPADAKASLPAHRRFGMVAVCAALTFYSVARIGAGIFRQQPNADYWEMVAFIRDHVPRDTAVLAASYVSLSLPQKSYDYYRVLRPYTDEDHPLPLAAEVSKRDITVIVRDSEWREHQTADMEAFLLARGEKLATFGRFEVFRVR